MLARPTDSTTTNCVIAKLDTHKCLLSLLFRLQMITPQDCGAFTAGISPQMLKSIGIEDVLVGHSERRELFAEADEFINAQCLKLIENNMRVVLCIGESLEEFEKGLVNSVCEVQLKKALCGVSVDDMKLVTIAYEPIWAIGTGKVATPEIAQSVHEILRKIIAQMYGEQVAEDLRILYGGSVTPESVDGLMSKPDIDGTLVGGASLDGGKFGRIINFQPVKEAVVV
jgi:triosephosphate isomerase (TIM)